MNEYDINITAPGNVVSPEIDLSDAIATGINAFLGLTGGIAIIAFIIAGILWALAAGDEEKIARARRILFSAVVGLFLALSAWGIVGIAFRLFTE